MSQRPEIVDVRYQPQIKTFMAIVNEFDLKISNILDLGCGPGFEAGCLGLVLGTNVHGLELDQKFHPWARPLAKLMKGSALSS